MMVAETHHTVSTVDEKEFNLAKWEDGRSRLHGRCMRIVTNCLIGPKSSKDAKVGFLKPLLKTVFGLILIKSYDIQQSKRKTNQEVKIKDTKIYLIPRQA